MTATAAPDIHHVLAAQQYAEVLIAGRALAAPRVELSPRQALALAVIVLEWRATARTVGLAMEGTRQPWEAASRTLTELSRRGLVECLVDDLGPRWSLTTRGWMLTRALQDVTNAR